MTIRTLTYKDIPSARRREAASKSKLRLQERLADRSLTEEQRSDLLDHLATLDKWLTDNEGELDHG